MPATFCRFATTEPDAFSAVSELIDRAGGGEWSAVFLFVEPTYDLEGLAAALRERVRGPVLACTSCGGLTDGGYVSGGFVAAVVKSPGVRVGTATIEQIGTMTARDASQALARAAPGPGVSGGGRFGVLLLDGLLRAEERVAALLHGASGGLPIVGGSAADGWRFERTLVFDGVSFREGIAVLGVFECGSAGSTFRFGHHESLGLRSVVTRADPSRRVVYELDAAPAAEVYAKLLGVEALTPDVVAGHPLLVRVGGTEYYARSVRDWDGGGAMTMFCALETGTVVHAGRACDLVSTLEGQIAGLRPGGVEPGLVVAFDCIQRRMEVESRGDESRLASVVAGAPLVGFSTYGEQHHGLHVNYTMTGVAFAA